MSYDIYFDLETGGLELTHPIIQIAAAAVQRDTFQIKETFEQKISFLEHLADPEALRINHYDAKVWEREAIILTQTLQAFNTFLSKYANDRLISKRTGRSYCVSRLYGYNSAAFDGPRIKRAFDSANLFMKADLRIRDIMQVALWVLDRKNIQLQDYTLSGVCTYLNIPLLNTHDALGDVRLTVLLAEKLSQEAELL